MQSSESRFNIKTPSVASLDSPFCGCANWALNGRSAHFSYIMIRYRILIPAAVSAVLFTGAGVGLTYTGEELAKDAKVTLAEARAIALKAFPGKITDEELEKEKGGSGLRYSFDIEKGRVIHEVGVDAKTGRILENSVEGSRGD